jgi:hypothetical protein
MRWSGSRMLADVTHVTLREEAERARFYAQMLLHRFRDPVTADRLRAVAADLERQAAAWVAFPLNRNGTP